MQKEYQYMVDFTLPQKLSEDFLRLIPHQRAKVSQLFREGKLVNYALSLDHSKLWAIFNANSQKEVEQFIFHLPLTRFMQVHISMLTFYNAMEVDSPAFSMN